MNMNLLSIKQPWAWLIANGYKDVENRTWATAYRGPLAIHASGGMTIAEYQNCRDFALDIAPEIPDFPERQMLQRGGIVAFARLADCTRFPLSGSKWHNGGYFGWCLEDIQPVPFYPMAGGLGLRKLADEDYRRASWERDDALIYELHLHCYKPLNSDIKIEQIQALSNSDAALYRNFLVARIKKESDCKVVQVPPPSAAWWW
jgi:hypothetical protein